MHDELPDVSRWAPTIHRYETNSGSSSDPRIAYENAKGRAFAVDFGPVQMIVSRATYDDMPRLARLHARALVDERYDRAEWRRARVSAR